MVCTVTIVAQDESLASAVSGSIDMLNTANIINRARSGRRSHRVSSGAWYQSAVTP